MGTGETLTKWYDENKRDLPWRRTRDPYAIWVSEIMLQQTRVDTVIGYYNRFMEKFPDVQSLANAEETDLLQAWEGLGYYSRARNMQKAAKIISKDYNGIFPCGHEAVHRLPGIGEYTAGAILSIAFNQPYPAVDGNVLRVISRITGSEADIALPMTKQSIGEAALAMMPEGRAGDYNQALMELGATVCTPQAPHCMDCPIQTDCKAYSTGRTNTIPVKNRSKAPLPVERYWAVIFVRDEKIWTEYRREERLLGKLWGLPLIEKNGSGIADAIQARYGITVADCDNPGTVRHTFTHKVWEMEAVIIQLDVPFEAGEGRWVDIKELSSVPIPTAFRKVLETAGLR